MDEHHLLRRLLCELGDHIRNTLVETRARETSSDLAAVSRESSSDTIYHIDKITEDALAEWFERSWPANHPVQVVMEGLEEDEALTFPRGTPLADTRWKCIIDPIDGTRGIMYDKRSAWMLAGIAPQRGAATRLLDIVVAAMTELPTSKQWRADQLSAIRGGGVIAEGVDIFTGERVPLRLQPSQATHCKHGFSAIVRYFPEGRALTAQIDEKLWDTLYGLGSTTSPLIFDDQYISTGGQFYELLVGHDRMLADLRPMVLPAAGFKSTLLCHPYDACTALILREAGVIVEQPDGSPMDAPMDTTSPVAWVAYANAALADHVRPALRQAMADVLG